MSFFTVRFGDGAVEMIDQRALPSKQDYLRLRSGEEVARAIEDMAVRGAPAIGVSAALGIALELERCVDDDPRATLDRIAARLARTRPTAVNLTWAIERMKREVGQHLDAGAAPDAIRAAARESAQRILDEDVATCRAIGDAGAQVIEGRARLLTHCNAGALATAGYGTALGVVRSAAREGRLAGVLSCETRPFLQGARLTAWELQQDDIPVRLITDSMGGALMARGEVDVVVVGADRIARNGDVANKIGTYSLAVLAHTHGIPFYVAAPLSTVDFAIASGDEIPIEQRSSDEVTAIGGQRIAPEGVEALHPAFDVTPARYVSGIVTEVGVLRAPYDATLDEARRRSALNR